MLFLFAGGCSQAKMPSDDAINRAVEEALSDDMSGEYEGSEYFAQGFYILDKELDGSTLDVCVQTKYSWFGYVDDVFTVIAEGAEAMRISFEVKGDTLELLSVKTPLESNYESYCALFDEDVRGMMNEKSQEIMAQIDTQILAGAQEYIAQTGRDVQVVPEYQSRQINDMNIDAANELLNKHWQYPYWEGTTESVEDGVRYIYRTDWEPSGGGDGLLTYTKSVMDGETVEVIKIQIENGKITYLEGE